MDHADFVHLVRLSEHDSAANSHRYRRSIVAFAALGYGWVVACLGLGVGLLVLGVSAWLQGPARGWQVWIVLLALGLIWSCLRAMWVRIGEPEGALRITPEQAPLLFEALERIRQKVKGPPIHVVYVDDDFNASITQVPRWGMLGGVQNTLTLGLPLVMALDRSRLLAVLAHEYGHLRADHGRFTAWVYRTRQSWQRLYASFDEDTGPVAMATRAFFRWYFPRFQARTFAMARQDEYEADRISAKLLGRGVAAAALVEIEIKAAWLHQTFWAQHWRLALTQTQPVRPYQTLRHLLKQVPEPDFAQGALRQALGRASNVADTHPRLRERLEALEQTAQLPAWSTHGALGLLGPAAKEWIAHFDQQWCSENADNWRQHHARLQRWRLRVLALTEARPVASADELVEETTLRRWLHPQVQAQMLPLYERALQLNPQHGLALLGAVEVLPPGDAQRVTYLERLWDSHPHHQWRSAQWMVELLEQPPVGHSRDPQALKLWRQRRKDAEAAELRAQDELVHTDFLAQVRRHDLRPSELAHLQAELAEAPQVARAWLVCKNLHAFPQRRAYLLYVQWAPGSEEADDSTLLQALDQHLDGCRALPGPFYLVTVGLSPSVEEVRKLAGEPIHTP